MDSWWRLGEGVGQSGSELAIHRITCAFCTDRGNFKTEHHAEMKKPNGRKKLNFDTMTNVVDVYINYLRRKIDSGHERTLIRTIRGVGYQIGANGQAGSPV